jgi:excisionase family DNA binding protein
MDLLTISEVAKITRMSASWWRQRVFRKEINYLKIGRSVRIPRSTVDEVLRSSHVDARNEERR